MDTTKRLLTSLLCLVVMWSFRKPWIHSFLIRPFNAQRTAAASSRQLLCTGRKPLRYRQESRIVTCQSFSTRHEASTTTDDDVLLQLSTDDKADPFQELQWVAREILRHDDLYYNQNEPELSDDEYDALCRREEQLCRDYPTEWTRFQEESGMGEQATRYMGRVGTKAADRVDTDRVKQTHGKPMLSLDNVHNTEQLLAWLKRVRKNLRTATAQANVTLPISVHIRTEPKLDGVSLNIRYEQDGDCFKLAWASTRGDGRRGQDVTRAARLCQGIPESIKLDEEESHHVDTIEVRGEVVLPKSGFLEHLKASEETDGNATRAFSNARNAASGILLRKDATESENTAGDWSTRLRFYAYELHWDAPGAGDRTSQLTKLGFCVPSPHLTTTLTLNEVDDDGEDPQWDESDAGKMIEYHNHMEVYRTETTPPKADIAWADYDMDGCVHKVTDLVWQESLGNSNRAPRWAVAHKFAPSTVVTELLDVYTQVGRTGAITPVALLKPVDIGGVFVQRATLHNFGHMQHILGEKKTVHKGLKVTVRRAGDVIPQVVSVVGKTLTQGTDSNQTIEVSVPTHCPTCGSPVTEEIPRDEKSSTIGGVVRCTGPPLLCPARSVSAIQHAFSRDALDIKGLSAARIEQLKDLDLLHRPSDLFKLATEPKQARNCLLDESVTGWGEKSVSKLLRTATKVSEEGITLSRYIYSLGIRYVGIRASEQIASLYGNVDAFLADVESASGVQHDEANTTFAILREDRDETKGIGASILQSLSSFSSQEGLVEEAKELATQIRVATEISILKDHENANSGLPWEGWRVVFTGAIPSMPRSRAKDIAKRMGAKTISSTVSRSTNIVIAGSKGGKKLNDAMELGITVLDAEDFVKEWQKFQDSSLL